MLWYSVGSPLISHFQVYAYFRCTMPKLIVPLTVGSPSQTKTV